MTTDFKMADEKRPGRAKGVVLALVLHFAIGILSCSAAETNRTAGTTNAPVAKPAPPPEVGRDFFNAGTRALKAGKLREAEAALLSTVAENNAELQPAALYNLGHARYAQGEEELKKMADGRQRAGRLQKATARVQEAIQNADTALASNEENKMIEAYQQGRGARKELNAATKAVRQAMDVYGNVLLRWQRAAGDFKSAAELAPANTNATHNADVVNRRIAWLIDQVRQMQQALSAAAQAKQQLGDKMNQLKGRMPAPDAPPGGGGPGDEEEEDGEDKPNGPQAGHEESAGKMGEEMKMSPEAAERMLNGIRRDGERRLPMGQGEQEKPKDPNRPTW